MKNIFVLIGPSGSGKSTVAKLMKEKYGAIEFVSDTTRFPRIGESHGKDYYFDTEEEFEMLRKNGELLEESFYAGNHYGLTKKAIYAALDKSDICVTVLDRNGAFAISKLFEKNEEVKVRFIFVHARISTLYLRMVERGDKPEKIAERLQNIFDKKELTQSYFCDFTIFNDDTLSETEHVLECYMKRLNL